MRATLGRLMTRRWPAGQRRTLFVVAKKAEGQPRQTRRQGTPTTLTALMRHLMVLCLSLALCISAPDRVNAQSPTLDAIEIQVTDDEFVAIGDGVDRRIRVEGKEEVIYSGARGRIGIVLTNRRLLAVSFGSRWVQERLLLNDKQPRVELAANVALCVTAKRVISYSPQGGLAKHRLIPGEFVRASRAHEFVAGVLTNKRVMGFSNRSPRAAYARIRAKERYELRTLPTSITVTSAERTFTYGRLSGIWSKVRH